MQYLERTLQMKAALLAQPELLEKIRQIFASHIAKDGVIEPIGQGTSRFAYEVGTCALAPNTKINVLLKLKRDQSRMRYERASSFGRFSERSEIGAFEMYYDFVAGHLSAVSFRSTGAWENYRNNSRIGSQIKQTFSLSESWGGTRVAQGDLGAIPYFQLVVCYQELFGYLTEGEPPHIKPQGTATGRGIDENTVEGNRIIDLGPDCFLADVDQGGFQLDDSWADNIGMRERADKYFHPDNRLDL